jgi:hypothetical protein
VDRISALRNVEEALAAFEAGETDLAGLERRVRGVLRTYATEFDGEMAAYRTTGGDAPEGVTVLAESRREARERVAALTDADAGRIDVERVE